MMRIPNLACLLCAFGVLSLGVPRPSSALDIYRIGGANLDAPEQCGDVNVTCHFLEWDDVVDAEKFGSAHLVAPTPDFLQPEQLDPSVNLTPLIRERGGSIRVMDHIGHWSEAPELDLMFDGDYETAYTGLGIWFQLLCGNWDAVQADGSGLPVTSPERSDRCRAIWIQFGEETPSPLPINRIVMQPSQTFFNERFIPALRLGTNDGGLGTAGAHDGHVEWRGGTRLYFDVRYDIRENTTPLLDLKLPDEPVAGILFQAVNNLPWEIAELEIYADGFASQANYTTQLIPLGCDRADLLDCTPDHLSSLGELTWGGEIPEGARLDLSMRSGDDDDPNIYWRKTFRGDERTALDAAGRPLTRRAYGRLEAGEKAGTSPDQQNWEFWTPPLDFEDGRADLVGDRPHAFVQLQADFSSSKAQAGARLDFLQFAVSTPPAASQVVAEIEPQQVPLAELTRFTYKLRPDIGERDLGFDTIEIETPVAPASVDEVRIGLDTLRAGEFGVDSHDGERFAVQIPRIGPVQSGDLIEVVFQSEVFKVGTVFSARVFDSHRPHEVHQRVTAGDADPLADSNSLTVHPAQIGKAVIRAFRVSPFTPNGDGINDVLQVEYDLVNVAGQVPAALGVFDLSGSRIASVLLPAAGSGRFPAAWDGTDDGNDLVPPGLYLLRLEVETDRGSETALAAVPVVY